MLFFYYATIPFFVDMEYHMHIHISHFQRFPYFAVDDSTGRSVLCCTQAHCWSHTGTGSTPVPGYCRRSPKGACCLVLLAPCYHFLLKNIYILISILFLFDICIQNKLTGCNISNITFLLKEKVTFLKRAIKQLGVFCL